VIPWDERLPGRILVLVWITMMSACTAVGVVWNPDPLTKLNDAEVLATCPMEVAARLGDGNHCWCPVPRGLSSA
jgi:hypothetical protein